MMASSTTMPSISRKANREIMFRLTPVYWSMNRVPVNATPIPTHTHQASLGRRNRTSTRNTSSRPPIPFLSRVFTRPLKGTDESCQTASSTPGGSRLRASSTQAWTTSLVFRVSGSDVTKTCRLCDGLSLKRVRTSWSSKPSTMVATSPSMTWVPSRVVSSGMRSKSYRS